MNNSLSTRLLEERLPRYTSYPTAPHFSEAVSSESYQSWLASIPGETSASLYVHVPFCRSMCWYCGCHTKITRLDEPIENYLTTLSREINLVADQLIEHPIIRHLHFGGGTPTIMSPQAFLELVTHLRQRFSFADNAELAIEIDPRTLSREMTSALAVAGITRASLGIQSLDPVVQRAVNRVQDFDLIAQVTEDLRAADIRSLNFDLIYGLPLQTEASCIDTARQCIALQPERFAVFGYAHVPSFKKHQRKIDEAALAGSAGRLAQADAIAKTLVNAGYQRIGFDHFALPGDAISSAQRAGRLHRNFQGYTDDCSNTLIGFGASAIGRFQQGYVQNEVSVPRYAARVTNGEIATARGYELTAEDRLRADIIERLMCDLRIDLSGIGRRHAMTADRLLEMAPRLNELANEHLVQIEGSVITIPESARLLIRTIASTFDAYLSASNNTYSSAV